MYEDEYYEKAKKIVKKKKEFRQSATAYAIMMPVLIVINLWTSPGYLWFFWAMLGWGMGLIGSYYEAYIKPKKESRDSHEIQKEIERMRRRDRDVLDLEPRRRDELDDRMDLREVRKDYDERDFV